MARFTEQLLPALAPQSSTLLVELLAPPAEGCQEAKEKAQTESDVITQGQSQANQNEYLALGIRSRELGVVPDILRANCEQMRSIASPEGGVLAYMETIASLLSQSIRLRLERAPAERPLVVAYGGALHNDATPRPGRESWSYAADILAATEGAYLEVDLMVPALVGESESWQAFAWYEAYRALDHEEGALLMQWGEHSFSLFFEPRSAASSSEEVPSSASK